MNLLAICKPFATEDQALDYLIKQRWPEAVRCLACDHQKVYRIATRGKTRKPCRLFECADCGLHFSATSLRKAIVEFEPLVVQQAEWEEQMVQKQIIPLVQ